MYLTILLSLNIESYFSFTQRSVLQYVSLFYDGIRAIALVAIVRSFLFPINFGFIFSCVLIQL
jgi:hypothetical protein